MCDRFIRGLNFVHKSDPLLDITDHEDYVKFKMEPMLFVKYHADQVKFMMDQLLDVKDHEDHMSSLWWISC